MTQPQVQAPSFEGLGVVSLESRRAREMATLIQNLGGAPTVAPSLREVPLEENAVAFEFAQKLLRGEFDAVIFLTGVGTRYLMEVLETRHAREELVRALSKVTVVARGPKPIKVLQELKVPVTITVPEPNTWREVLHELDENPRGLTLAGSRVAVQEYGISNAALISELEARGASVFRVPVYRWALPEDLTPLRAAIRDLVEGRAHVLLITNAAQAYHLVQVAEQDGQKPALLEALRHCVVCSIGPTSSEALAANGIAVDLEPEHPKMGQLVYDAARRSPEILRRKAERSGARESNPAPRIAVAERREKVPGVAPWHDSPFMKACRREPAAVTPVWLMRQAGRYMKEYRELRARVPFLQLCKDPNLVAEVTVTAAERIGADAAILFADLLLIAEPLGFELQFGRGEGPVVAPPLREPKSVDRLREVEPRDSLEYLLKAIRRTRASLDPKIPLLGFVGAPFTLASYLIEGGASRNYVHTKRFMYRDAGAWRALMEHLARNLARYVNGQIEAGVQAVQVFDTWVGCLGPADYREFVLPYSRALIGAITPGVPVIHFGTGTAMLLEAMREAGGDVIGLDSRVELDDAWARLGAGVGVQGNLDPVVLYAEPPYIRRRVKRILEQAADRPGHIFNLGHGILPDTPFENVVELVRAVHEISAERKART